MAGKARWRADSDCQVLYSRRRTKAKGPANSPEETLEELLDIVANVREEMVAVERRLEQLRADISKPKSTKLAAPRQNLGIEPYPEN